MNRRIFSLSLASVVLPLAGCRTTESTSQQMKTPPPGFAALFNGNDLAGWWGASTEEPRQYQALSPDEFKTKHDASLDDIRQHWSVQNGELVNDGSGLYLTTEESYGDFELLVD